MSASIHTFPLGQRVTQMQLERMHKRQRTLVRRLEGLTRRTDAALAAIREGRIGDAEALCMLVSMEIDEAVVDVVGGAL